MYTTQNKSNKTLKNRCPIPNVTKACKLPAGSPLPLRQRPVNFIVSPCTISTNFCVPTSASTNLLARD